MDENTRNKLSKLSFKTPEIENKGVPDKVLKAIDKFERLLCLSGDRDIDEAALAEIFKRKVRYDFDGRKRLGFTYSEDEDYKLKLLTLRYEYVAQIYNVGDDTEVHELMMEQLRDKYYEPEMNRLKDERRKYLMSRGIEEKYLKKYETWK